MSIISMIAALMGITEEEIKQIPPEPAPTVQSAEGKDIEESVSINSVEDAIDFLNKELKDDSN